MKKLSKPLSLTLALVLLLLAAVSCAAQTKSDASAPGGYVNGGTGYSGELSAASGEAAYDAPAGAPVPKPEYDEGYGGNITGTDGQSDGNVLLSNEKIIYTASANIESLDFDESVRKLEEMIHGFGGIIESSYVSGKPIDIYPVEPYSDSGSERYYQSSGYRSAYYVFRVPATAFESAKSELDNVGNVTSRNTAASNITAQYTDVEARLKMYRTEEERLFAYLEKADNVSDMLRIESQLSNVRYNIEYLTAEQRNLDNRIAYSTVTVNVTEVAKYTKIDEPVVSYWGQISAGFGNAVRGVGGFFAGLFKWLVTSLPWLALIAAAAAVVYFIFIRRVFRKRALNKTKDDANE
ncbi:MAG: DUF4349 domain-containing protein [Oscillospiraceae bacterium]|jgi:hypothetical protein|nr:DUF4349 domain-containing protein [Oscillospiraceae bacterium]